MGRSVEVVAVEEVAEEEVEGRIRAVVVVPEDAVDVKGFLAGTVDEEEEAVGAVVLVEDRTPPVVPAAAGARTARVVVVAVGKGGFVETRAVRTLEAGGGGARALETDDRSGARVEVVVEEGAFRRGALLTDAATTFLTTVGTSGSITAAIGTVCFSVTSG